MNPSLKRLLGALLLIGTLGVSTLMAVRSSAAELPIHSVPAGGTGITGVSADG